MLNKKIVKRIIVFTFLMFSCIVLGQHTDYKKAATKPGSNYYKIIAETRAEFNTLKKKRGKLSTSEKKLKKQFERWAYFWRDRVSADGAFPSPLQGWYNAGVLNNDGSLNITSAKKVANEPNWVSVGPTSLPDKNGVSSPSQLGRVNTFWSYKHTDPSKHILFVGTPTGGLWKSTDNGNSWTPKLQNIAGIGITDIKSTSSDASNNGTIYVSTGDWDVISNTTSIGIYKSTDLGETFQTAGLNVELKDKAKLSNLVVFDDNTVVVGTKKTIQKTTDGGTTWKTVFNANAVKNIGRLSSHGNNIMAIDHYSGIYFSSDKGDTWQTIQATTDTEDILATTVDASNGKFYVINSKGEIKVYDPAAASPTFVAVGTAQDYITQAGYNQTLYVNGNFMLAGGVLGTSSADGGKTWYRSLNGFKDNSNPQGVYLHPDIHAIGQLDNPLSLYVCHDGGLDFVTYASANDQKPTVTYKTQIPITQSYTVAISPQNENFYVAGNQDNSGFSQENANDTNKWVTVTTGDGTCTAIDYSNSKIRYLGLQEGDLRRTENNFANVTPTILSTPSGAGFIWPLKLHTTTPTTLFGGFGDLYKSTNKGDAWTNLNSNVGQVSYIETDGDHLIVIGRQPLSAGLSTAKRSTNGGATWSNITQAASSLNLDMNSIAINPQSTNTLYVTVDGYQDGNKVFKSTDGGQNWTNISTGLPNIVMKQVKVLKHQKDEILFVATELGVYAKVNNEHWKKFGTGLPNVIVNDMEINYTAEKLVIATYGRGIWKIDLKNTVLSTEKDISKQRNTPLVLGNPVTNGQLKLKIIDGKSYTYTIYNTIGGTIASGKLTNTLSTINLSAVRGLYIIKFRNDKNEVATRKILIK